MFKRIALLVAILVCFGLGVYFTYFHRPPTADILAANLAIHGGGGGHLPPDEEDDSPTGRSLRVWKRWVKENGYVSIGKLFNKCNGTDKIMVGTVIMLPDEVNGGVTSRTYLNVTLQTPVTGGQMFLKCQYNGNDLYSNQWDLCTVEEGTDDRIIYCPVRPGRRKFVKNLKIPNYLPKGRYSTKAWLTNQNEEMIGCAFADFKI